jgi:ABC-type antimicrobial peptide transport system ATPase subunit
LPAEPAAAPVLSGAGCPFVAGCPVARPRCAAENPQLATSGGTHAVACHFPLAASGERVAGEVVLPLADTP